MITVYNLTTGCGYDKRVQWAALIYLTTQFLLFLNFYMKSYTRPKGARGKGDPEVESESVTSTQARNGVRLRHH